MGFDNIIISFNNDNSKSSNRGLDACIKNFLKLLNYFDKNLIKICLPVKNDFGDMNTDDFEEWSKKLDKVFETDQSQLVLKKSRELIKQKKLSKTLMKKLVLLDE